MTTSSPPPRPAGPKRQQRGVQLPQLLLSLLVVAVFALLAVWWQASTTSREAVVALIADIEQGEAVTADQLGEIFLSTDIPAQKVDIANIADFIGARPVTDLPAGTILTRDLFVKGAELQQGQAFVGLVLDRTRAPLGVVTGDRVQVLTRSDDGVDIISPDARVERADYTGENVTLLLRLGLTDGQRVQTLADQVVVIEVENSGTASWEIEAPS